MPKPSYAKMSADELEAELIALNNAHAEARKEILDVAALYDQKRTEENALKKLEGLTERELEVLSQHVGVQGAPSKGD